MRVAQGGPQLSWGQLTGSRACASEAACAVFKDRHPSTVAMTVLVVVEMFNALNALSENNSLLQVRKDFACAAFPCCPDRSGSLQN
jgi:hypothetical protein